VNTDSVSKVWRPNIVDYPLLGEPPVVEFVNTLYVDPDGVIDFLATVDLVRGWFNALHPTILTDIDLIDESTRLSFVELRNAVRSVFDATEITDVDSPIAALELAVNASPGRLTLIRDAQNRLVRHTIHDTTNPAGVAAFLADAAITITTTHGGGRVLICDRPACNMRYFQQHRRRRYCNPACANSDRQTRFQKRHKN
jgi:predicted RNA-binding Zn ribbon-like protein